MQSYRRVFGRLGQVGLVGLAAMWISCAPSCRAQEVNPDHFMATGIDGINTKQAQAPVNAASRQATPQVVVAGRGRGSAKIATAGKARTAQAGRRDLVLTSRKTQAAGRKNAADQQ